MFKRLLTLLGIGEHAEFIWACLDWLGLTKPINWLFYALGSGMGGYLADAANWSPIWVFLVVIGVGAALCLAYGIIHWVRLYPAGAAAANRKVETPVSVPIFELEPDITASDAYFKVLEGSDWVREQRRTTTDTSHLRRDWLEFRLSRTIHAALLNSKLNSWGEECLHGMVTTPQKPIPPPTWNTVEISFDARPQFTRTAAYEKGPTTYQLGRQAWVDVKFSSRQIFAMFPLNAADDWRPIFEAVAYVAARTGDTDTKEYLPKARLDLRQRALDKKIVIRGRKSAKLMGGGLIWSEVETEITNTYWEGADLHITAAAADAGDSPQTFPHRFSSGLFGDSQIYLYTKLRVNWPDILKEWPSC